MTKEHKEIFLQPWCDSCDLNCPGDEGRMWCQDDPWGTCAECGSEAVKYVLAETDET